MYPLAHLVFCAETHGNHGILWYDGKEPTGIAVMFNESTSIMDDR